MVFVIFCLFICFGVFRPTREFFIHITGDLTVTGEGLKILIYTRHSWSLGSEGSLTNHS